MAEIHARSFTLPRPWRAAEIEAHNLQQGAIMLQTAHGFLLAREAAGEIELLTLAVDPDNRRIGEGKTLVKRLIEQAKLRGAQIIFLEVAETNDAAQSIYVSLGFKKVGRRKAYYGGKIDAVVMRYTL